MDKKWWCTNHNRFNKRCIHSYEMWKFTCIIGRNIENFNINELKEIQTIPILFISQPSILSVEFKFQLFWISKNSVKQTCSYFFQNRFIWRKDFKDMHHKSSNNFVISDLYLYNNQIKEQKGLRELVCSNGVWILSNIRVI